jgi:hypothetical protein
MGMVLEYNQDLVLGKYKLEKDLYVICGKYSFRLLDPKSFFKENGDLILRVIPIYRLSYG